MFAPMRAPAISCLLFVLVACGDDGGSSAIDAQPGADATIDSATDASIDAAPAAFTLTSPTITAGGVIPLTHVCTNQGGMNLSPALAWTDPPAGTMSFAVVFTDIFNVAQPFAHSAIYDIPATATGLPADVDKVYAPPDVPGAHQTLGYNGTTRGYLGPCPNAMHTYEFAVYALPTATLTGAMMSTGLANAISMIKANNLGVAKLTGTHTPP